MTARTSVEGERASREVVLEREEGGGLLYIGCNLRSRLGHWLSAADHMHVIILQNAMHNESEPFLQHWLRKSRSFILELSWDLTLKLRGTELHQLLLFLMWSG